MKYKALMLDIDGTTIPNTFGGMPSEKVTKAIAKASKVLHIGVATSRPYLIAQNIVAHLSLSGPSIFAGGGQILDVTSQKIFVEHTISLLDFQNISETIEEFHLPFFIQEGKVDDTPYTHDYIPEKIIQVFCKELSHEMADKLISKLSDIPTISLTKIPGYEAGKVWMLVSNIHATKQHGILEVAKILGIHTNEIIGVGDGYNDFPLLLGCGLKIAMGNAVPELKAIADYVAPTVDEDGVAEVISKFVL